MKLICSIALALAILIQRTHSMADAILAGPGAASCAKIAEAYRQWPTEIENYLMMNYAQGVMTGMNLSLTVSNGQHRDVGAISTEDQGRILRAYCDEHPMAEFYKAVLDLYNKLPIVNFSPPSPSSR